LRSEVTFYKNLFDKLSIEPQILRVGEFKSAAEPYSRTEMSGPFREEMEAILDDYHQQMLKMIADARKISVEKAGELVDQGVLTAAEAREAGLVDAISYEDEFQKSLPGDSATKLKLVMGYGKKKLDTDFSGFNGFVKMMNLLAGVEPQQRKSKNPKIAVISAVGVIMPGKSQSDLLGTEVLGAETLIKAIREARDDETVKAIVLRIDSPGGSALASDLMWHELEVIGKPVIASMGDTAASGGYYIAMGADRIFAEPGTLTGSIGVVGGKIAFDGLFQKVGVNTSVVQRGKNAGILSMTMPFSESERTAMQKLLDDIYRQFTTKAAGGRKMEVDKLEKLARGRVYTGNQALKIGLVDELGTLEDAIAAAKKAANIPEGDKVEKLLLPKAVSPLEQLFGPLEESTSLRSAGRASLADLLPASLHNVLEAVSLSDLLARERILTVLPYKIQID
jgi:protease-4